MRESEYFAAWTYCLGVTCVISHMLSQSRQNVKPWRVQIGHWVGSSSVGEYNPGMRQTLQPRSLPNADRLSVLAATILLAYALARFINLPERELAVQLPGVYLSVQINIHTIVALLVAGLTASGADWLLRDHPALDRHNPGKRGAPSGKQSTLEHWLLPALTAWVIGLPLSQLPPGPMWWAGFALGGGVLMLVLVAEYIVVDPEDIRQPPAAAGLTAVSFALYLALAVALRFAGIRLFLLLPALSITAGLVSLRAMHLRLHGRWAFVQAAVIALIIGQIAAALHYWPLAPVTYGMVLLGPAYALTSLISSLEEAEPLRKALIEPLAVLIIVWGTAVFIQ